jgi:hypothetical protein
MIVFFFISLKFAVFLLIIVFILFKIFHIYISYAYRIKYKTIFQNIRKYISNISFIFSCLLLLGSFIDLVLKKKTNISDKNNAYLIFIFAVFVVLIITCISALFSLLCVSIKNPITFTIEKEVDYSTKILIESFLKKNNLLQYKKLRDDDVDLCIDITDNKYFNNKWGIFFLIRNMNNFIKDIKNKKLY